MNRILNPRLVFAILLAAVPLMSGATTYFTDNFSSGSTTNLLSVPGGTPTASFTSYDIASGKNTIPGTNGVTIAPNDLKLALGASTSSGWVEAQALFTTNPVALTAVNDYIEFTMVFTNTSGTLLVGGTTSGIWVGLFNSGSLFGSITNYPVAGGLAQSGLTGTAGSAYATGNCANWQGYVSQITSNLTANPSRIVTRPIQNNGNTTSANQELLGNNAGTGAYNFPAGAILTSSATPTISLTANGQYTVQFRITLTAPNTLVFSNALYSGAGTGGAVIFSQMTTNISGANFLTAGFDGLGIGVFNKGATIDPTIDITSILINGTNTVVSGPPTISAQPVPVTVATNGYCVFSSAADGFNVTYQWHRNGTNLLNGGNISGANNSTLIVSSAGISDAVSSANGYYVTISGAGGYSTNSVTNSLVLVPATNLTWSAGGGNIWDLNNTISWTNNSGVPTTFNYGDPVTFDDTASLKIVNFSGSYLGAASVTVDTAINYTFQGAGSFAGPGSMLVKGSGQLTLNNANTFSGGTTISNATAYVLLQNYNGLGTGPVNLAMAGGQMEIVPAGSATLGINGTINVADDFRIQVNGSGAFATVFLGDLSGTAGKTLTLDPKDLTTTNRFRVYGNSTVYNANLVLNGPSASQAIYNGTVLAAYGTGTQTYNGVISGNGGFVPRSGTTVLTGANTYSGGTFPTAGTIAFGSDTAGSVTSGPIGTGPLFVVPEVPNATGSGTVLAFGGARTIANPIQYPSATNNQTLIIGGSNQLTFSGSIALQGQDGLGTFNNRIFQVNNTAPTIFSGVISDGGFAYGITKTGTNTTLYLNNANTYTGMTTNSAGVLAGSGSIAGSVLVQTNASIGGGSAASIGTLTINGNLTLALGGGGFFRVNRSGSISDKASVAGTLSSAGTGTITVTNLGSTLQIGDTFTVFNKTLTGGGSLVVTGGLTSGLKWTNNLAVNGSIQVVQSFATYSTNITYSVSGSTLTISWPATHQGWFLQAQTNNLNAGLGTNWVTIPGTDATTSTNLPVISGNPSVFYRLKMP